MRWCTKIYIFQVWDDIAAAAAADDDDDVVVDFCLLCILGFVVPDDNDGKLSEDL